MRTYQYRREMYSCPAFWYSASLNDLGKIEGRDIFEAEPQHADTKTKGVAALVPFQQAKMLQRLRETEHRRARDAEFTGDLRRGDQAPIRREELQDLEGARTVA